ncbi:hypothetical protein PCANC_19671 [Puccinia coronata f. sp. avenae]|uniref:DNA repair metallo-beta-lactamase domain-containing protein n=1 Tax=Puccinia coronata f. sp. avenae TaxID=200324 RepID=A0A2N5SAT4_9BASI|nr:hypothetical protein PCANC_19671 [Puccinia coronata f. sp. avenae]
MKKTTQTSIDAFFSKQTTSGKKRTQQETTPGKKEKKKKTHIITIEDDDDDDDDEQQQQEEEKEEEQHLTCPVCAKNLSQQEAQRHINLCLDRTITQSTSAIMPLENLSQSAAEQDNQVDSQITGKDDFKQQQEEEDEDDEEEDNDEEEKQEEGNEEQEEEVAEGSRNSKRKNVKKLNKMKPQGVKTGRKGAKTRGRMGQAGAAKRVPFYKLMPGTTLSVDCFSHGGVPGVTGYFLSHAHSDHYTKLSSTWSHGKIYCSKTTANLVALKLRVHPRWIVPLDFNRPYTVDDVQVVLIDANHCPGSAMFLFEGVTKPEGKPFRYLHCGDFRAMPSHLEHPALRSKVIDICYLDTTYLDPKYCFPAQDQVIKGCCKAMKSRVLDADPTATMSSTDQKKLAETRRSRAVLDSWLNSSTALPRNVAQPPQVTVVLNDPPLATIDPHVASRPDEAATSNPPKLASIFEPKSKGKSAELTAQSTLILVGTYSIGKERIVISLAETLGTQVYCADARKVAILKCIDEADEEAVLQRMLTTNPRAARIHLVNLFALNKPGFLETYLAKYRPHFTHIIGIKPTGWCYKPSASAVPCNPSALPTFITAFQQHQQARNESSDNAVGQLIFPEKVKASIAPFVEIYGVPYSEHSSFFELSCFCMSFDWVRIIPTVNNGNPASRAKMKSWIDRWKTERVRLLSDARAAQPCAAPDPTPVSAPRVSPSLSPPPPTDPLVATPPALPALLIKPRDLNYW